MLVLTAVILMSMNAFCLNVWLHYLIILMNRKHIRWIYGGIYVFMDFVDIYKIIKKGQFTLSIDVRFMQELN